MSGFLLEVSSLLLLLLDGAGRIISLGVVGVFKIKRI